MLSSSNHPLASESSTSIDSTTALAADYRPPQKNYAAAYAALQDQYGSPGFGQKSPDSAKTPSQKAGGAVTRQSQLFDCN